MLRVLLADSSEERGGDLIDADIDPSTVSIEGDRVDERRQQRGSQSVHLVAQCVGDGHRAGGDAQLFEPGSGNERWIPRLREAGPGENLAHVVKSSVHARRAVCVA